MKKSSITFLRRITLFTMYLVLLLALRERLISYWNAPSRLDWVGQPIDRVFSQSAKMARFEFKTFDSLNVRFLRQLDRNSERDSISKSNRYRDTHSINHRTPFPKGQQKNNYSTLKPQTIKKPLASFDINRCDTTQLMQLRGIGPAYARRIVRYRVALGGFVHLKQLGEVYQISPQALQSIEQYAYVAKHFVPSPIVLDSRRKHPYLTWESNRLLKAWIKQHGGNQARLNEISPHKSPLAQVTDSVWTKVYPYLKLHTDAQGK